MKKFYIGSLELQIKYSVENELWQWDEMFLKPVLPVSLKKNINISIVLELPAFSGMEYRAPGLMIYDKSSVEWRVYDISKEMEVNESKSDIISCQNQYDEIEIFIKRSWWKLKSKSFRPWFYIHLEELLLDNQAMILHSASIIYQNNAILFTAPSGTGKTTQTNLWHEYMEDVEDLNGDRTLVQYTPEGWYGCGFPVFGSTVRCEQKAAPLKAIIILRQGEKDEIRELSPVQKLSFLYSEITVPSFKKEYTEKALSLLERLIEQVPVLMYYCTMEKSAVQTLHDYLFGGQ